MTALRRLEAAPTATRSASLGRGLLTALVVGSMVGSGVFSLPQNMAAKAGPAAVLIGWVITGAGMLALAFVFQSLAARKPGLDAGPYAYARAGFGDFVGFNSAWGYWISAWIGNVSYAVVLFSALSYFFPVFGEGNTWQAISAASLMVWCVHALLLAGIREAAIANAVVTVAKIAPVILFIVLVALAVRAPAFTLDVWGEANPALGSLLEQVKGTMLVTVWAFIGIEGASVVSKRARKRSDVGFATMSGFLVCLVLYALVSLLAYGVMTQGALAGLRNPSMAGVLEAVVGPWGAALINLALVVSVLGAFLSWTLLAAELPSAASVDGLMPGVFGRTNDKGSPSGALWITNGLVQAFLILTYLANATYLALLSIASVAILVPYALCGAYALKLVVTGEGYQAGERRTGDLLKGAVATIYALWLLYAADLKYLFMGAMLYAAGTLVFIWARMERGETPFRTWEVLLALVLVSAGGLAAWFISVGRISPL